MPKLHKSVLPATVAVLAGALVLPLAASAAVDDGFSVRAQNSADSTISSVAGPARSMGTVTPPDGGGGQEQREVRVTKDGQNLIARDTGIGFLYMREDGSPFYSKTVPQSVVYDPSWNGGATSAKILFERESGDNYGSFDLNAFSTGVKELSFGLEDAKDMQNHPLAITIDAQGKISYLLYRNFDSGTMKEFSGADATVANYNSKTGSTWDGKLPNLEALDLESPFPAS